MPLPVANRASLSFFVSVCDAASRPALGVRCRSRSDRHRAVVAVRPGPPRPASGFPRSSDRPRTKGATGRASTQPPNQERPSNRGAKRRTAKTGNRRACVCIMQPREQSHDHVPPTRQLSSRAGATELGARRQPRVPRSAPRGEQADARRAPPPRRVLLLGATREQASSRDDSVRSRSISNYLNAGPRNLLLQSPPPPPGLARCGMWQERRAPRLGLLAAHTSHRFRLARPHPTGHRAPTQTDVTLTLSDTPVRHTRAPFPPAQQH